MAYRLPGVYPHISVSPDLVGLPGSARKIVFIGTGSDKYTISEGVTHEASGASTDILENYAINIQKVYSDTKAQYPGSAYKITGGNIEWIDASAAPSLNQEYVVIYDFYKQASDLVMKEKFSLSEVILEYGYPTSESEIEKRSLAVAAEIAFRKGASSIYCIQVDPTAIDTADANEIYIAFKEGLAKCEDIFDAKVIVPLYTETTKLTNFMQSELKEHIDLMSGDIHRMRRIGLFGLNEVTTVLSIPEVIAIQQSVADQRIGMAYSGYGKYIFDFGEVKIPGCFLAAEIAALNVSVLVDSATPITNKVLTSFSYIPTFSNPITSQLSNAGIMAVRNLDNQYRITEGTSTDRSNIVGQEISVITSTDEVVDGLQLALEKEYIGTKFLRETLLNIHASADSILEKYKGIELIQDFEITSVVRGADPQQALVYFKVLPIFADKWIDLYALIVSQI